MAELELTRRALADMPSNMTFGVGAHREQMLRTLPQGRYMGSTEFRPARHLPSDINQFSLMGMAFEQAMVDQFETHRPLAINIITDASATMEKQTLTDAKQAVARNLGAAIMGARIAGDRVFTSIVGDDLPDNVELSTEKIATKPGDAEELRERVVELASRGLSFVISGFHHLQLPQGSRFGNLIAIKVNHPWERELPERVGIVHSRGYKQVDTYKPRQLRAANDRLEEMHRATVAELESHGAQVASIVVQPKIPEMYDIAAADKQIAAAVRAVSRG